MLTLTELERVTERLRALRTEHLDSLEESFVVLKDMRLFLADGSVDIGVLQAALDYITVVDGSLQGVLEFWASSKTTFGFEYNVITGEYEHALDVARDSIDSFRVAKMSWAERDAHCRLQVGDLHLLYVRAGILFEFINATIYEIKARQKYLYAKRQTIDSILSTVRLQLKLL